MFHEEHERWGWRNIQRGGIKHITCDGEKYVTVKYKRVVCWLKGHSVITPSNPEVENFCKRCGKREV